MIQEKDKYRLLIENLPDGLAYCKMVRDSSGKPLDYIFLEVNIFFEILSGLPRDYVIGKKLTEIHTVIEDLSIDWIDVFKQVTVIELGQNIRFQQYFIQRERWYDVTAYSDQPGYLVVIFQDITERKQAERELIHSERMAIAGQLAAGVAHEFNNLLSIIGGSAEYAKGIRNDNEINKSLNVIVKSVNRGAQVVKKLLTFAKRIELKKESVDLIEVIEEAVGLVKKDLENNSITVVRSY